MQQLSIKNNFPEIELQLKRMRRDVADKALRATVNRVATVSKTAMSKEIRSNFNLKAAEVGKVLKVDKARRGRNVTGIAAKLLARPGKRSINLIRFRENKISSAQARRRRKEGSLNVLRFKIKKRGKVETINGAFVGNKGRTVFRRTDGSMVNNPKKQKIEAVWTIGIAQMFNTKRVNRVVIRNAEKRLAQVFDGQARRFTEKFNARR